MTEEEVWNLVTSSESSEVPNWIGQVLCNRNASKGSGKLFDSREELIDISYLQFLKNQIKLCVRGREWNQILTARLEKLKVYLGKTIICVTVRDNGRMALIKIDQENRKFIYIEEF